MTISCDNNITSILMAKITDHLDLTWLGNTCIVRLQFEAA